MTYRSQKSRIGGFTLIELLVAVAVTAVLLTLLFGPLIQSFFFTGQAQAEATAQSTARTTMEQVSRETGSAAGLRNTQGKYLNMLVMDQNGTETVGHSYNAYLDIVPPRPQTPTQNALSDPTIDPNNATVTLNTNTGAEQQPPLILSIAPGTGFIRYFLGLKYPISLLFTSSNQTANEPQPYYNPYDETNAQIRALRQNYAGSYVIKNDLTNTYILYRAEVLPEIPEMNNGTIVKVNGNTVYVPNWNLFSSEYGPNDPLGTAGKPEPDSQAKTDQFAQPVIDDPDFYRVVTAGVDINPITNAVYTAPQATDHNLHVYNWTKVAKPQIAAPVADLIAPPRDSRGNIQYNTTTGYPTSTTDPNIANPNGPAIPVMPTTVSFGPALISGDTLAATNNEYASQGFGSSQVDVGTAPGDPYIPAIFKATYGQWQGTPAFTIYQNDQNNNPIQGGATGSPFTTGPPTPAALAATLVNNTNLNRTTGPLVNPLSTDLIEYDNGSNPVYDVTQNTPFTGVTHYVALSFDPAAGAADFALTALPTTGNGYDYQDTNNASGDPYWQVTPLINANDGNNNEVDFQSLPGSYLFTTDPNYIPGAQIVPNSDRVFGPDETFGGTNVSTSTTPPLVPYTRVTATGSAALQANQYAVNYATGTFYFAQATPTGQGPAVGSGVAIAFNYQNNLYANVVNGTTTTTSDTVRATYNTGSLTQLTLGIRIYDVNSKRPAFFSLTNRLSVGNARR